MSTAETHMAGDKLRLFVSYSRRDMAAADALVTALEDAGFDVVIDRRDLPYGEEWQKELADFIRGCDTVVWLVSPDSVTSKWCNWELGEVGRLNKRLVPVKIRYVVPEELPESLGKVHLLPVDGTYEPTSHLTSLVITLNTDRSWTKEATRLADRAREWIARDRNDGLLLRGAGLKIAETWSTAQPKAAPPPAGEVLELILASRRAAVRRQRWIVGISASAAVIAVILMAAAIWQAIVAQTNEVRAVAGEKLAKANEEQAKTERDAALTNQSRFLVDQARQADESGDQATAAMLSLEALPDKQRGRARPYLPAAEAMLYRATTAMRERHTWQRKDTEDAVRFLPDGQRLITFSQRDRILRIRDAATGTVLATLESHTDGVETVAFSPDGQQVLTGSRDDTARLWNAAGGTALGTFKGHAATVLSASFSPDGRRIVTGSADGTARIWQADNDAAPPTILAMPNESVDAAYFSPDGGSVVTKSSSDSLPTRTTLRLWDVRNTKSPKVKVLDKDEVAETDGRRAVIFNRVSGGKARIWDVESGRDVGEIPDNYREAEVAFSSDGQRIAIASMTTLKIWQAATPNPPPTDKNQRLSCDSRQCLLVWELEGRAFEPVFSPDGQRLATRVGRTTTIWNSNDGDQLVVLHMPDRAIAPPGFSPDGQQIVTLVYTSAQIWNVEDHVAFRLLHRAEAVGRGGPRNVVSFAAFSPDGQSIVTVSGDDTAKLWNTASGALLGRKACPGRLSAPAVFAADGRQIATACADGRLRLWEAASDATPIALGEEQGYVNTLAASRDGQRLVSGTADGDARIWAAGLTPTLVASVKFAGPVQQASFSPDGRQVLLVVGDRAWLWNGQDGSTPAELGKQAGIRAASFSPDGAKIVLAQSDRTIRILNAQDAAEEVAWRIHVPQPSSQPRESVTFSPDGKRVLAAGFDKTARVYDAATGAELAVLSGHEDDILSAAYSSNGWILTTSRDRSVRLWTSFATTQALIDYARALLPRDLTPEQREQYFLDSSPVSSPVGVGTAAKGR